MKSFNKRYILTTFLLLASVSNKGMNHINPQLTPAIVTNLEVVSNATSAEFKEFYSIATATSWRDGITVGKILFKYGPSGLKQQGEDAIKYTPGITNALHKLLNGWEEEGYKVSHLEEKVVEVAINADQNHEAMQVLKKYCPSNLYASTNYDTNQAKITLEKLAKKGLDIKFLGMVSHKVYNANPALYNKDKKFYNLGNNNFASDFTPHDPKYFSAVEAMLHGNKEIIYIDKDEKALHNAEKVLSPNFTIKCIEFSTAERFERDLKQAKHFFTKESE